MFTYVERDKNQCDRDSYREWPLFKGLRKAEGFTECYKECYDEEFSTRIIVEIKLSTNGKVVEGYTKQIARYNESEETSGGFYVVIDVGNMGKKDEYLVEEGNKARKEKIDPTTIVFVDALEQRSASKL